MSKYNTYTKKDFKRPYKVHPIWRGIGFLMMIIIPIVAWFSAELLVAMALESEVAQIKTFTTVMARPFVFPDWVYAVPGLNDFARWIRSIPMIKAQLLFSFFIILIFSGLLSVLYSMIYRASVPRYSPLDEPAPKIKPKKYTR
jgi:hypothetical protein